MLALIVRYRGEEKKFCFTKRVITLGPKSSPEVDIPLPIENLETPHAKIVEHNGRYTIHNLASDPHVKFNDFPFGRRTLTPGTVIRFHDVEVVVHKIDDVVQETIVSTELKQSGSDDLSLLMKEVDSLQVSKESETPQQSKKLLWLGLSALGVILLACTMTLAIYFSSNARSEETELKVARGLSDAAMALFYANTHNIKPPNRNWSEPKFLEQILSQIIPKSTKTCCDIDSQGNFTDFPYILRIYTNDDASRFLLLAQPKPSFIRWFHPRDSLVIDSSQMELRKLKDIQPLNRIIFNSSNLNSATMRRVALLVNEGQLIPIQRLDLLEKKAQFSPPDELKIIAPGAQNLVYNAPRYYKITEPLLTDALDGGITTDYLQDLNHMISIPNLVFYTTEGMKTAIKAYKNLNGYIDADRFLVGYFTYDKKTHLPGKTELLVMNQQVNREKQIALNTNQPSIKFSSELYQMMDRLSKKRKQALKPVGVKIYDLIHQNNESPNKNFKDQLVSYLREYHETDIEQQHKISLGLSKLYKQFVIVKKSVSKKQFLGSLKSSGLISYVKKPPKKRKPKEPYNPLIQASGRIRASDGKLSPSPALN